MTDDRSLERAARSFIEPGPTRAPEHAVEAALLLIQRTSQERDLRLPWRVTTMSSKLGVAAAAVFGVLLVGGLAFFAKPGATVGTAPSAVVASATPGPSVDDPAMARYQIARDAICATASEALNPLKLRFALVFDETLTRPQWNDWITALEQFADGYDGLVVRLDALTPQPELLAGHAANVQQIRDLTSMIRSVISELRQAVPDGSSTSLAHLQAARGIDSATDPISRTGFDWEAANGLGHCP